MSDDKSTNPQSGAGHQAGAQGTGSAPVLGVAEMATVRAAWTVRQPGRAQYAEVVQELNTLIMFGEGRIFDRGPYVPVKHMAYFKPPVDAFFTKLQQKDRRSAKERDYVNSAGVWADIAYRALSLAKAGKETQEQFFMRLTLAEKSL